MGLPADLWPRRGHVGRRSGAARTLCPLAFHPRAPPTEAATSPQPSQGDESIRNQVIFPQVPAVPLRDLRTHPDGFPSPLISHDTCKVNGAPAFLVEMLQDLQVHSRQDTPVCVCVWVRSRSIFSRGARVIICVG